MNISHVILMVLLIDFLWLTLNRTRYDTLVKNVQGVSVRMNYVGAILSYLCVIGLLIFYAFPLAREKSGNKVVTSIMIGGFLGMLSYGIFNATNIAIFEKYDWSIALLDTLWGSVLFTIATLLYLL